MFKEFSLCSPRGFALSLLAGAVIIAVFAALSAAVGNTYFLKLGFSFGLMGARFAEGLVSRSCPLAKVSLEGAVLALMGFLLVIADDLLAGLLA